MPSTWRTYTMGYASSGMVNTAIAVAIARAIVIQYQAAFWESKLALAVEGTVVCLLVSCSLFSFSSWMMSWVISCSVKAVFSWFSRRTAAVANMVVNTRRLRGLAKRGFACVTYCQLGFARLSN